MGGAALRVAHHVRWTPSTRLFKQEPEELSKRSLWTTVLFYVRNIEYHGFYSTFPSVCGGIPIPADPRIFVGCDCCKVKLEHFPKYKCDVALIERPTHVGREKSRSRGTANSS